jgi:hypothetical protein
MALGTPQINDLPDPTPPAISAATVGSGPPIPAIERIRYFNDSEWEDFVLEWAGSLGAEYEEVGRLGGAGDQGRDIVGIRADGSWDNYQCKHLLAPLTPSNIWVELGKLLYYTHIGEFDAPRRYFFIAPQGAGPKLSNLLRSPEKLREGLAENWAKYCETKITTTATVPLDGELRTHFDGFDFGIFKSLGPNTLIDQHATTPWHAARFGGGLPPRPDPEPPPPEPTSDEAPYVRALLDAYADHLGEAVDAPGDLAQNATLREHFADARREFYSAEALRTFSRDRLPPRVFEELQGQIFSGIGDDLRDDHDDGYRRVLAVVKTARVLVLASHALNTSMVVRDRGGVCHQLANDGTIKKWVS